MDKNYVKTTTFGKRVVHGMLLASFLSRIEGMYLPGKHELYFSQSIDFQNPCFIDDIVTVSSVVIDKSVATKILKLKSEITNQDGEILISGIGKVLEEMISKNNL